MRDVASSGQLVAASAIVLTGGRSRRFGADKMAAEVRGAPLLHHALRSVAEVCDEIVVVAGRDGPSAKLPDDIQVQPTVVADVEPYAGPLVALVLGAGRARNDRLLLVAGDMPDLEPALLRRLLEWPADRAGASLELADGPQPFPLGLDRAAALASGRGLVDSGRRRLQDLLAELDLERIPEVVWRAIDPEARTLRDIDRPEDLGTIM